MKRSFTKLLLPVLLIYSVSVCAQTREGDRVQWALVPVRVDGISSEWKHPLSNYNKETKLAYSIANDDKNLYILIESADQATSTQIQANSLTLSINAKGKKKTTTAIGFPLNDRGRIVRDNENEMIQIDGFDKMPVGTISLALANTYGIMADASADKNKVYVYELAIPLKQLGLSMNQKKQVAFNFKINGFANPERDPYNMANRGNGGIGGRMPGVGGTVGIGRNGMPGFGGTIQIGGRRGQQGGQRGSTNPVKKVVPDTQPVDFWVKYKLASSRQD